MPERPTYDGFSATCLLDPAACRDRTDVVFREEARVVNDAGAYNGHEAWAGRVAVGVVRDGAVLLVRAPDGWALPSSPVRDGDDWAAVARRRVAQKTGRAVALDGVERVTRRHYRLAGAASRETTGYDVVFRARLAGEDERMAPLQVRRANDPGDAYAHDWFASVPADAADGDFREDAEWFAGA